MSINEQVRKVLVRWVSLPITDFSRIVDIELKPLGITVKGIKFTRAGLQVSLHMDNSKDVIVINL